MLLCVSSYCVHALRFFFSPNCLIYQCNFFTASHSRHRQFISSKTNTGNNRNYEWEKHEHNKSRTKMLYKHKSQYFCSTCNLICSVTFSSFSRFLLLCHKLHRSTVATSNRNGQFILCFAVGSSFFSFGFCNYFYSFRFAFVCCGFHFTRFNEKSSAKLHFVDTRLLAISISWHW